MCLLSCCGLGAALPACCVPGPSERGSVPVPGAGPRCWLTPALAGPIDRRPAAVCPSARPCRGGGGREEARRDVPRLRCRLCPPPTPGAPVPRSRRAQPPPLRACAWPNGPASTRRPREGWGGACPQGGLGGPRGASWRHAPVTHGLPPGGRCGLRRRRPRARGRPRRAPLRERRRRGPQDAGAGGVRPALGHRQRRLRPPGGLRALGPAGLVRRRAGPLLRARGDGAARPSGMRSPPGLALPGGGGPSPEAGGRRRAGAGPPGPARTAGAAQPPPGPGAVLGEGGAAAALSPQGWARRLLRGGQPGLPAVPGREQRREGGGPLVSAKDFVLITAERPHRHCILTNSLCNSSPSSNPCAVLSLGWKLFIGWSLCSMRFSLPAITFVLSLSCRWVGILALYTVHKGQFNCPGGGLLHSYLLVLLVLLASIICALSALVYVSMQGK